MRQQEEIPRFQLRKSQHFWELVHSLTFEMIFKVLRRNFAVVLERAVEKWGPLTPPNILKKSHVGEGQNSSGWDKMAWDKNIIYTQLWYMIQSLNIESSLVR